MRSILFAAGVCLALYGAACRADIYRCTGAAGEPLFSQLPCAASTRVVVRPQSGGAGTAGGVRASEKAWLEGRARARRQASAKQRRSGAKSQPRRSGYACAKRRRALDKVKAELRRGYKPARGERLRRRRTEHEAYLDAFCG